MSLELMELSIVVVAQNHNPTILNPDFLYRAGIVPDNESWKPSEAPITTEVFSRVVFQSGIEIVARPDKVIFVDRNEESLKTGTTLPSIAAKFLETLAHVTYSAVGINPTGVKVFASQASANEWILEKFFKTGPWLHIEDWKLHPSLALTYKGQERQITLKIDEGIDKDQGVERHGAIFKANYHYDLPRGEHEKAHEKAIDIIRNCAQNIHDYMDFVEKYFLGGENP